MSIYGNASLNSKRAATDSGLIFILANEEADRQKALNRGQQIKAER